MKERADGGTGEYRSEREFRNPCHCYGKSFDYVLWEAAALDRRLTTMEQGRCCHRYPFVHAARRGCIRSRDPCYLRFALVEVADPCRTRAIQWESDTVIIVQVSSIIGAFDAPRCPIHRPIAATLRTYHLSAVSFDGLTAEVTNGGESALFHFLLVPSGSVGRERLAM